jgi:putative ABC transport system permease protein
MNLSLLGILQFALVYLLLIIVLVIMKKAKVNKTKQLLIASLRMTVQLVLAGFVLTLIFDHPNPIFTALYLLAMMVFSTHRSISRNKELNFKFKVIIAIALVFTGLSVLIFFITAVVGANLFNAQYAIPLGGMVFGNTMTGLNLGLQSFIDSTTSHRLKSETLLSLGITPKRILLPYVNNALETALLPTINSMIGMGIIFLPGMMTGQILAGEAPMAAILYQIAIMIAICTAVCSSVFIALIFGYKTMYNNRNQFV